MSSALSFYAELLSNIRSISLSIALPTPATASTCIAIAPGSSIATVHHDGRLARVALPAAANPGPQELIVKSPIGEKTAACRLPLASSFSSVAAPAEDNYAPWSAPELSSRSSASFGCRSCNSTIISDNRVTTWKDLPSGNWADLMDFWHCHKPHDDKKQAGGDGGKYSAFGTGFLVEQGTGLVDRGYFLFSNNDCETVQAVGSKLKCSSCETLLGVRESGAESDQTQMWRLNKWNLCLNNKETRIVYPLECFLSAQFISYAEECGVRRLFVTDEDAVDPQSNGLKVWIFNTDIRYTHTRSEDASRGIKILWQTVKSGEIVQTDSLKATGFEDVALDFKSFDVLKKCLEESNNALPGNMSRTGEWNVGALRRFSETP